MTILLISFELFDLLGLVVFQLILLPPTFSVLPLLHFLYCFLALGSELLATPLFIHQAAFLACLNLVLDTVPYVLKFLLSIFGNCRQLDRLLPLQLPEFVLLRAFVQNLLLFKLFGDLLQSHLNHLIDSRQ